MRRYQDLFAWQLGERFKLEVYRIVGASPAAQRDLRFMSQILEAARGVPSNITEGFLRCSPGDFMRFLDYASASLGEAEQRLHDGIQLNYFKADDCIGAFDLARRCLPASVRLKQSQRRYLEENRRKKKRKHPPKSNPDCDKKTDS